MAQLGHDKKDEGLAVITVSLDDPEDESTVLEFLQQQNATFDNLLSKFGVGKQANEAFGIPDSPPFYKLYDRTGNLRYQFSVFPENVENAEHVDAIDQRVEQLLAEK